MSITTSKPISSMFLVSSLMVSLSQLIEIDALPSSHPGMRQIQGLIRELRDDELEHLDTAVDFHSQRAPAHALLSAVVELGCGAAIKICQRI